MEPDGPETKGGGEMAAIISIDPIDFNGLFISKSRDATTDGSILNATQQQEQPVCTASRPDRFRFS